MGTRSTIKGYWRQGGNSLSNTACLGVSLLITPEITFDPTAASSGTGVFLPKGAVPIGALMIDPSGSGGEDPTVDVGITDNADGILAEALADTAALGILATGDAIGVPLTADTEIVAGVGASAGTGGEVTVRVLYCMDDDGVVNN